MKQTRTVLKRLSATPAYVSEYRLPELIATRSGDPIFVQRADGEEHSWRLWRFIAGSKTCDPPQNPLQIRQAARAFGAYQHALAGLEPAQLVETIPGFLRMADYADQFDQALTGWGMMHLQLKLNALDASIVIASGQINYAKPVGEDIAVRCSFGEHLAELEKLKNTGRGRFPLTCGVLLADGSPAGEFSGIYAVRLNR